MVAVSGILIVRLCYDFFRDFVSKSVKKNLDKLEDCDGRDRPRSIADGLFAKSGLNSWPCDYLHKSVESTSKW